MSLVQCPRGQYRNEVLKGRFYHCPYTFPRDSLVLVRPLHDASTNEIVQGDIMPISECSDPFDHYPYEMFGVKGDEELIVQKTKYRRVIVTTIVTDFGLVNVAPVFTLKPYHSRIYDMEKLRNNELGGLIYLKEGEHNKSSYISLIEAFPVYIKLLKPLPLELSPKGMNIFDDNIAYVYDLYSTSSV